MFKGILLLLIAFSSLPSITPCVNQYAQCGGKDYVGAKDCCPPYTCQFNNDYYSQCLAGTAASTSSSSSSSAARASTVCNALYSQCGGQNWSGSTCCVDSTCVKSDDYYSQCVKTSSSSGQPSSTSSPSTTKAPTSPTQASSSTAKSSTSPTQASSSTAKASTSPTQASSSTAKASTSTTKGSVGCSDTYGQCAGTGWTGPTTCCSSSGSTCQYINPYYSQCIPVSGASTTPSSTAKASASSSSATQASTASAANDGRTNGVTTRYWDCCKASCGWGGKALVSSPVKTCDKYGITQVDVNAQSGCNSGPGYMCNNQQPWSVSDSLSYGYAAAFISGNTEFNWCCACYSLIFTTGLVAGKELIVQVTNTGGDLGSNHFDLQMPGGGVGIFDGCSSQFTGSYSWGQRYGGISQKSDCYNLPSELLSGCLWRFNWFQNADNPPMRFKRVKCPAVLTANTKCIRNDENTI